MKKKLTSRDMQAIETRKNIFDTAIHLMQKYGYGQVTVSQICDACGVAKGTFYHYFSSKKDIISKLTAKFDQELSSLYVFDAEMSAIDLYTNAVTAHLHLVRSNGHAFSKSYLKAMMDAGANDENIGLDAQRNFIYNILNKGREEGTFHSQMKNEDFFSLYSATLIGCLTLWCMGEENMELVETGQRVLSAIIELMR